MGEGHASGGTITGAKNCRGSRREEVPISASSLSPPSAASGVAASGMAFSGQTAITAAPFSRLASVSIAIFCGLPAGGGSQRGRGLRGLEEQGGRCPTVSGGICPIIS